MKKIKLALILGAFFGQAYAGELPACGNQELLKGIGELIMSSNKLPTSTELRISGIDYAKASKKLADANTLNCKASLEAYDTTQKNVLDKLEIAYGVKLLADGKSELFFSPVRK